MKKLISFLALSFCALAVYAQATHNMKITFQDGNTVVYGMENVKTVEFVEKEEPSAKETYTINGVEYPMPEAVDLGLPSGTKWASMNIGAKEINDVGGYYCWADPTGELNYYSYEWRCEELDGPWTSDLFGGVNPPHDIAGTELDIATQKIGNGWCLPSFVDFRELDQFCVFSDFETYLKITGPNGNSIIIPHSGMWAVTGFVQSCDANGNIIGVISYPEFQFSESGGLVCLWGGSITYRSEEEYNNALRYNQPAADFMYLNKNGLSYPEPSIKSISSTYYRNSMIPIRAVRK